MSITEWQKKRTLIYVFPETRENLKKFGQIGDTYNDAINRIVEFASKHKEEYREWRIKYNKKKIVWDLMRSDAPPSQQLQLFYEKTGKSRATFYRIKKKIEDENKCHP